jgi:hypothetical protein
MKARRVGSSKGNESKPTTSRVYEELEIEMDNRAREVSTHHPEKHETEELTHWSEAEADMLES